MASPKYLSIEFFRTYLSIWRKRINTQKTTQISPFKKTKPSKEGFETNNSEKLESKLNSKNVVVIKELGFSESIIESYISST